MLSLAISCVYVVVYILWLTHLFCRFGRLNSIRYDSIPFGLFVSCIWIATPPPHIPLILPVSFLLSSHIHKYAIAFMRDLVKMNSELWLLAMAAVTFVVVIAVATTNELLFYYFKKQIFFLCANRINPQTEACMCVTRCAWYAIKSLRVNFWRPNIKVTKYANFFTWQEISKKKSVKIIVDWNSS